MISNVIKNITCGANQDDWTEGATLTLNDRKKKIRCIKVWFSNGCSQQVYVQIRKGGVNFIPSTSTMSAKTNTVDGDAIVGDGYQYEFPLNSEMKISESIEIFYRNTDAANSHDIMVTIEFGTMPTERSQLRS